MLKHLYAPTLLLIDAVILFLRVHLHSRVLIWNELLRGLLL
jgi:hypothetical protein